MPFNNYCDSYSEKFIHIQSKSSLGFWCLQVIGSLPLQFSKTYTTNIIVDQFVCYLDRNIKSSLIINYTHIGHTTVSTRATKQKNMVGIFVSFHLLAAPNINYKLCSITRELCLLLSKLVGREQNYIHKETN